jgi:hypothetical protein
VFGIFYGRMVAGFDLCPLIADGPRPRPDIA